MMKLKNIFKKNSGAVAKAKVQTLDKKQLEKVIGGVDTSKEFQSAESQLKEKPRN